jgi:hypothetical protein
VLSESEIDRLLYGSIFLDLIQDDSIKQIIQLQNEKRREYVKPIIKDALSSLQ